jgi:DNA-binding NarL/FixJ family response regulator
MLAAPRSIQCSRFALGAVEYMLVAHALDLPEPRTPLTSAERDVAMCLLRGRSLAQIASQRKTSMRTIANQAASIYRKLGVRCRLELGAPPWNALLDGEWRAVGTMESDNCVFLLAKRSPTFLTEPEKHALALRARASSIKVIAFDMGVSESTVSRLVKNGMRKLGLR